MIPLRLVLKNFLSYREASLDFRGLHTACICGANGAGKSSLLEAIAWAIWGESRANTEDDVIHLGAQEAQVDFIFTSNQHTYRILRRRSRGQASVLEFQIAQKPSQPSESASAFVDLSALKFRSITAKGVRATQQLILDHLRLDYETFINSAYLRQGRADEFMLKRPGERKQILADLLKLNQYDELAERAKDQARQLKGQIDLLERNLEAIQKQLQQQDAIAQSRSALETDLNQAQQQQATNSDYLQALQATQHERQTWHQQLTWHQQQQRVLEQDCQRLQQELLTVQHQQQELETLLQQESVITSNFMQFQSLQTQEMQLASRLKTHQLAQNQRQQYVQQQNEQAAQIQSKIQQVQTQLETLQEQEQEVQQALRKAETVEEALKNLQQARSQLAQLDQLQLQATPLLQRRQQLQTQLERSQARISARLDELFASARQLQFQQERQSQLQGAVLEVSYCIETLEQRRVYQQEVRERGLERRSFMERLQADQRNYEMQLADVEQKIQWLRQGSLEQQVFDQLLEEHKNEHKNEQLLLVANLERQVAGETSANETSAQATTLSPQVSYPPCPLCDRSLDEQHWNLVLAKHQEKQQEILNQVWVIREQLAVAEREIQVLRQEYRELEKELHQYPIVLERRGQLQEQFQAAIDAQQTLEQLTTEITHIERSLQTGDYATELYHELHLLDESLERLNYDEKNHALARGDVDRWRWAEIKYTEIKQAQRKQAQITQRKPELESQLETLKTQLEYFNHETNHHLNVIDKKISEIGYSLDKHNELQASIRQFQIWQLRYQELQKAQQQYPGIQQRVKELRQNLQERHLALQINQGQIQTLIQQLQTTPDLQKEILELEKKLQQRRLELDEKLAALGRLQQQQQQLESLKYQSTELIYQLHTLRRQYRVYHELSQAFGKNGIQALMIENVLPQLEAETNRILARLSANQLHVQFITQKSNRRPPTRGTKAKFEAIKLIETLDILIADTHGTRPYETYSGGEAFRVNFAIRLALARLLAQRSGTALQMLIVDEGFGTQDAEGCDRLIGALNAIASDFTCILTVTHVPHFKEAFQARIEVCKTEEGSQIQLVT